MVWFTNGNWVPWATTMVGSTSGTNSLVRELMIRRKRSKRHADETRLDDCDFFGRNPPPVGMILVQFHRYHLDYQQRLGVNPDQCCKARKSGSKRQNRLRISVKMYPSWIRSFWQNEEIKDIKAEMTPARRVIIPVLCWESWGNTKLVGELLLRVSIGMVW